MATTTRNPEFLGLVGAGHQAYTWGPALKGLEAQHKLELVSVADINAEAAQRFARRFGLRSAHAGDDAMRKMLIGEPEIGGVVIVGPHYTHGELALQAMELGVNVFVEKPMAPTVLQAREMLEAARENKIVLAVGYQYPWMVETLRQPITEGALGQIDRVEAWWLRADGIPDRRSFWDSAETGGVGVDLLGHLLAAVLHLVGGDPEIVSARSWNDIGIAQKGASFRAEDTLWATFDWPNEGSPGTRANFKVSWAASLPVEETIALTLEGARGRLEIPLMGVDDDAESYRPTLHSRVPNAGRMAVDSGRVFDPPPTVDECMVLQANNWIGACTGTQELLFAPEHALVIQEAFRAILESTQDGGEQKRLHE